MRVLFIGTVEFSCLALERLLTLPEVELVGVVSRRASTFNSDFASLAPIAEAHNLPCYLVDNGSSQRVAAWIAERRPDLIYCIGWSQLLGPEILAIPPRGVVGFHPTLLPKHRGRHPIIWALALGLEETGSSFFLMDEGADSGPLLSQRRVAIDASDDAATLYRRICDTALEQLDDFTPRLACGELEPRPQDNQQASYWRKRSKSDGQLDWRMGARTLHNLVRALHPPYPGADCRYRGREFKVWRSEPLDQSLPGVEPGKVVGRYGDQLDIQTGEGTLRLLEHDLNPLPEIGEYL